jgi:hypothetical protein
MTMIAPPGAPRKVASKGKEVDALSLDDCSLKMELQSVFVAAFVELDSFLAEGSKSSDANDDDDDSFASEERHLQASEVILRRALECIDYKDETDSLPSFGNRHDSSTESFDSPESQVPPLQAVSPFGSPISVCSRSEYRKERPVTTCSVQKERPVTTCSVQISSLKIPKRRQIRAYGLRPHMEDDKAQHPPETFDTVHSMATVLFGRHEYYVRPLFTKKEFRRTAQGTISVVMASGIVVADLTKDSPHMVLFILFVPALFALVQAHLPHRMDESAVAVLFWGTHTGLSNLFAL